MIYRAKLRKEYLEKIGEVWSLPNYIKLAADIKLTKEYIHWLEDKLELTQKMRNSL